MIADGDVVVVTAGVVNRISRNKPATHTNIMRIIEVD